MEHGAYRRLIDVYYIHETPLPLDHAKVYRLVGARSKDDKEAVDAILEEFFVRAEDGYRQDRCDHEIALCNKNRTNGKKGGRKPKTTDNGFTSDIQAETQKEPKSNPKQTQVESPPSPHHPITPSLLSEQAAAATECPVDKSPGVVLLPSASDQERAKTIADRLKGWAKKRGDPGRFSYQDPRIIEWVARGVRDPDLKEAWDLADQARHRDGSAAPINTGFLASFVLVAIAESSPPPKPPDVCRICGSPATRKEGAEWFCSSHDRFSKQEAAA